MFTLAPEPLITEDEIRERIIQIAGEMTLKLIAEGPIMVICLLRGSFVFAADLLRELSRNGVEVEEIDFIVASSYGEKTESTGNVKIVLDLANDVSGKKILVIDDILDSGTTLHRVIQLLSSRNIASLTTCLLLDKPSRREKKVKADFVGFTIEDHFVVGYGLDFNQRFRELPYIGVIEERA